MILGFDGSSNQNVFVAQKGLEAKVDLILNRISQMQKISCTGGQTPTVRVSVAANTPSGPVEAFDFAEYQPELLEKFHGLRSQHPYILTADTLKVYQNKFSKSSPDSVKVRRAQGDVAWASLGMNILQPSLDAASQSHCAICQGRLLYTHGNGKKFHVLLSFTQAMAVRTGN